ncbi:S9 family peptidase [Porticoccaceae bacterium]|nr:S9 family peptidase [Porticoccaceae bacterium]MDB2634012.1 S9 family peptidase [Porticoccaceae bacterium]MDB2664255.1 S9 family peptidase [Porticoccaceae bacterium]
MSGKYLIILSMALLVACNVDKKEVVVELDPANFSRLQELSIPAPKATKHPHQVAYHGQTLSDDYFWLKDQGYPEIDDQPVLDYLTEENDYYAAFIEPNRPLVDRVFEEFKGRTDESEESVPYIKNGYQYRWYFRPGDDYRTYSRKYLKTGEEQVILDESALAADYDYFVIGDWRVSPDNTLLAYTFDTEGDERYQLRIIDLNTGDYLTDKLEDVQGSIEFSSDGKSLVYARLEADRWHAKELVVHRLGESQALDKTIYYEQDDGYFLGFGLTSDERFLVLVSSQGEVQETYVLPADNFYAEPIKMVDRDVGFTLSVDHAHGFFYILANDTHKNFRFAKVSDQQPQYKLWQTIEEGSDDVYLMDLQAFDDFIAIKQRTSGVDAILIRMYSGDQHTVDFPESIATLNIGNNPQFDQSFVRLRYTSMVTPSTIFDYHLDKRKLESRKVQKIPSGYDKSLYITERLMAPSRDGVLIPVSLVYRKDVDLDGSAPMLLYGYGAYGATISPSFSTLRLSLLDRGFVYAIAHVRGGAMMGYQWYLDGKLEKRENTFNDFVDAARFLAAEKYTSVGNISISGRSAGGELMGAAVVQAPELWRSVNLGVPFVDVLNTMLDASLPLTPPEWKEWGNPIESRDAFQLLRSYSPYDNIVAREYPPMFVSGGLNDPRVTYWEPAKWTAKMRSTKTDNNLLVMRINMGAGHFANSGRYGRLKDYAEEYAFTLLAHGITE